MKPITDKEKFIELRSLGYSFEKISSELKVSKNTLVSWQKKYDSEINNLKFLNIEALISKHQLSKDKRVNFFLEEMQKIIDEMKTRDYKNIPTKDLLFIFNNIFDKLNNELSQVLYTGDIKEAFYVESNYENININF